MKNRIACFEKADRIIVRCVKFISYASMLSLLLIAILATIDVLSTKILSHSIANATELIAYLNIPVVFLCIAYVQLDRGHTHIDLLYSKFPQYAQKTVHMVSYLVGVVFCSFIGCRAVMLTAEKLAASTKSSSNAAAFLIWPFVLVIAIGFLLLSVAYLWSILRELLAKRVDTK